MRFKVFVKANKESEAGVTLAGKEWQGDRR
jgi:hypothetical protein